MQGLRKRLGNRTVNVTEVPRVVNVIDNSNTVNDKNYSKNISNDITK